MRAMTLPFTTNGRFSVRVRVPATSANLGPGFDTLGLALNLYNFVTIAPAAGERDTVAVEGAAGDGGVLPLDDTNIALIAARRLLRHVGAPEVPFHLTLENAIPFARGLGSSAAARVGALVAANEWAKENGWSVAAPAEVLSLATRLEGHPDNAAAALLGGLTVAATLDAATAIATRLPVQRFPRLLVFVPRHELATSQARGVLPATVAREDANFNLARGALLLAALAGEEWDLLPHALQDRLHQSQRAALMPGFEAMLQAARDAGAYGATLSGAGSSLLLWLPHDAAVIRDATQAVQQVAAAHDVEGEMRALEVDAEGCRRTS